LTGRSPTRAVEPAGEVDVAPAGGVGHARVGVAEEDVLHGGVDRAAKPLLFGPQGFGGDERADRVTALPEQDPLQC
jgi:hypothetical protein